MSKSTATRSVYKDEIEELINSEMRTTLRPREGFHREFARESSLGLKFAQGYELIPVDGNDYLGTIRMQDASQRGGGIRIPSGDNNDPLVAIEIPSDKYRVITARSQALADSREERIKSSSYEKSEGRVKVDTKVRTSIENKN